MNMIKSFTVTYKRACKSSSPLVQSSLSEKMLSTSILTTYNYILKQLEDSMNDYECDYSILVYTQADLFTLH